MSKEHLFIKTIVGVVGAIRYLEQFDNSGDGDYTAEKYQHEYILLSDEEIRKMFNV
ncbi:MAG: hypothetical protein ACERKV_06735 [Clostridiaceae bacterium]